MGERVEDRSTPSAGAVRGTDASLADLVRHLRAGEIPCAEGADGGQVWVETSRGVLTRLPVECTDPVARDFTASLLRMRSVWVVNHLLAPGPGRPANCVDYVCRDAQYDIERLDSNARRDVRRGLRSFEVGRCTWERWAEQGLSAWIDTQRRHGYAGPDARDFRAVTERWRDQPFYEIWGAWQGPELVAWLTVLKIDDWGMVDLVRSRTDALRGCPNNALVYAATRSLLVSERRRWVSYGTSSVQPGVNDTSMHRYKVRMGYEAVPAHRVFACQPVLGSLLRSRSVSAVLRRIAAAVPSSAPLQKVAGMSRLLRETGAADHAPLAPGARETTR